MYKIRLCILLLFVSISFDGYANNRVYYEELSQLFQQAYIDKDYSLSLKYLQEMESLVELNDWKDLQINLLNDMGHLFVTILEYDKAMQYFMRSYEIANLQQDWTGQTLALSNIGWLYSLEGNYQKTEEYAQKAYNLSLKTNDSVRIGQMAMNLAASANSTGKIDSAEKYIDIALEMLKDRKSIVGMPHAITIKIENLYLKGEYANAEKLALDYLQQFPKIQIDDIKSEFLLSLSRIYEKQNNLSQAILYAHESLNAQPHLRRIKYIYEHLSHLYEKKEDFLLALSYKDSAMIANDSLVKINEMDRMTNSQIRIDLLKSEKKLIENQLKQQSDRRFFIFLLLFVFILACVIIWILRIQSARNKQGKVISEHRQQIAELELDKEKNRQKLLEQQLKEQETMSLLEQERLNSEIEAKNRQLTAKVLFQTNRNKLIDDIIGVFLKNPELMESPSIQSLYHQLKMERQESVNNGFLVYFEQLNPAFLSILQEKHPDLTANDIRMLSYIYLNLSTKEIANLLNIVPDSLKKKKQRLAGKLGIDTTELYNYLTNIIK